MSQAQHPINIGDQVISWYDGTAVKYGGPIPDDADGSCLIFAVSTGWEPLRHCHAERVAPADTPIPTQDARVSVVSPAGQTRRTASPAPGG